MLGVNALLTLAERLKQTSQFFVVDKNEDRCYSEGGEPSSTSSSLLKYRNIAAFVSSVSAIVAAVTGATKCIRKHLQNKKSQNDEKKNDIGTETYDKFTNFLKVRSTLFSPHSSKTTLLELLPEETQEREELFSTFRRVPSEHIHTTLNVLTAAFFPELSTDTNGKGTLTDES